MKVKQHLKDNKKFYIGLGIGVCIAGITYAIMRGRTHVRLDVKPTYWAHRPMQSPPTGHIGLSFANTEINDSFNIITVSERLGKGHPGYLTRCVESGLTWFSQKDAALANGIHPNRLSDHLNGRLSHVDGKHFERIYVAP